MYLFLILFSKLILYLVLCYCYFSCFLLKLFSYTCIINITQKLYNKIHLNDVLCSYIIFYMLCIFILSVVTSYKNFFSCISTSSWWKLCYILNYKKLTLKINFIFQQKVQKKVLMISTFCHTHKNTK